MIIDEIKPPDVHSPTTVHPHIAQEYRETQRTSSDDELIYPLKDWAKIRALGGKTR